MSKYTPGPWRSGHKTVFKLETDDRLALDVRIHGGNQDDNKANARLIAAAPDLLEALKAIVASLSEHDDEGMIEHSHQMEKARAAIAKAESGHV